MESHDLAAGWTMTATGGPVPDALVGLGVPTDVPATSHTALLDAGLIPDPYLDRNEEELAWMRRTSWRFARPLDEPAPADDERVDLVLEGLDTVATVRLGDAVLARTANQHRTYRVDLRPHLTGDPAVLTVDLAPAIAHAEAEAARLGPRPLAYAQPFNMVRKMACSFGWDWGPDLQTAGIWRPVRVERWRTARLASVRPLVSVRGGDGRIEVVAAVERSGLGEAGELRLRAGVAGVEREVVVPAGADEVRLVLDVSRPRLWWPVGHGEQPLYGLDVRLTSAAGAELGAWSRRIGFRDVVVDTADDEHGSRFTLVVNGAPVFVKGANWIPDDHLLTRITRERLERRLDQALDARLNLVRVWGGGIYESEDFYELCDERGLLVWQDFLLACAAYPEESPLWEEIEAEAREHVARLAAHPSLVLWNGGNENLWGHEDWGWKEELAGRSWGERYALDLFARVVAELDPTRHYNPNSPSSPGRDPLVVHPNDPGHGTHHEWEVWNRIDYTRYRDAVPRFCSEFGFQGPPTWAALERAVRPAGGGALRKQDPVFLLHQKAEDGNAKLDRGMAPHLGVPAHFVDWHWAAQLNQARAVQHAVTHYRSWWPRTAGAIVWQLNDCWPVTSWAAVDGDGRAKPLLFGLAHAFADRLVTVQDRDGDAVVHLVNDTDRPWAGALRLQRQGLDGAVLAAADVAVEVPARAVGAVQLPAAVADVQDRSREVLVADLDDVGTLHAWAPDVDLALDPAPFEATAVPEPGGYAVTLVARSAALDVTLLVDRLDPDATVDDGLVSLAAGRSATLHVRTARELDVAALVSPPVLRSANDLRGVPLERAPEAGPLARGAAAAPAAPARPAVAGAAL